MSLVFCFTYFIFTLFLNFFRSERNYINFFLISLYNFIQDTKWVVNPICKLWWQPCSFTPSYRRRHAIIERKFSYETIKAWNLFPNFHPSLSLRAAESFCPSGLLIGFTIRTAEHPATLNCCYPHHTPEVKQWRNLCCTNRRYKESV